jgi:DNA-binding transcriptional regulator GbsR (MarR family)
MVCHLPIFSIFPENMNTRLTAARENFIAHWGAMGTAWGINRTMAQIHALLMVSPQPMNTGEIMETLAISRRADASNFGVY